MRYGADYPNPGHEAKNQSKSAPNAPYALTLPFRPRYANNQIILIELKKVGITVVVRLQSDVQSASN
ncbi:MAG: hypothetical protein F6K65_10750 [Moorea sp. SIO3C2]|nr:hypothetical protein [Moorena sp. SIO3C2]